MGFLPCTKKSGRSKSVPQGKMDKKFNRECLDEHNRLRSLHGCPPLKLSDKLAKQAQAYAQHLVKLNELKHSSESEEYGENLATRYSSGDCIMTGKQASLVWYSEIKDYVFGQENQLNCGHFTQVIWHSTKEAGFGYAMSDDGHKIFVVGQYYPSANYTNEYIANVPSPLNQIKYIPTEEELGKR